MGHVNRERRWTTLVFTHKYTDPRQKSTLTLEVLSSRYFKRGQRVVECTTGAGDPPRSHRPPTVHSRTGTHSSRRRASDRGTVRGQKEDRGPVGGGETTVLTSEKGGRESTGWWSRVPLLGPESHDPSLSLPTTPESYPGLEECEGVGFIWSPTKDPYYLHASVHRKEFRSRSGERRLRHWVHTGRESVTRHGRVRLLREEKGPGPLVRLHLTFGTSTEKDVTLFDERTDKKCYFSV